MATITKRGNRYQAVVRRTGYPTRTKTFHTRTDAQRWARKVESEIEARTYVARPPSTLTVSELLARYRDSVTPHKKGQKQEVTRINRLLRDPISQHRLCDLSPAVLAHFRDRRLKDGTRACQYDLIILRHALSVGKGEWDVYLPTDPFDGLRIPDGVRKRVRRLEGDEYTRIANATQESSCGLLWPLIGFAIETGMRKSEILGLRWDDVDWQHELAHLTDTKNGSPRSVPLTAKAVEILRCLARTSDMVFPIMAEALRYHWEQALSRAGIDGLRFHDLRHEAISRLFELGLSVPEVALISGHKTISALQIYANMKPVQVGEKLRRLAKAA